MLPTDINNGDVKGKALFNGQKACAWTTKEDKSNPTAANESIVITMAIDAK